MIRKIIPPPADFQGRHIPGPARSGPCHIPIKKNPQAPFF
jgi:hypothetical protein